MHQMSNFQHLAIITIVLIFFTGYHFLAYNKKIISYLEKKMTKETMILSIFFYRKMTGFIFMGILPYIVLNWLHPELLTLIGWDYQLKSTHWMTLFFLILLVIAFNSWAGKKPFAYERYPQMRFREWNWYRLSANIAGWILYLIAYEFLFRGILFFAFLGSLGLWPAIAVNLAIYASVHLIQGIRETLGCLVFGMVLCLLVWNTGSLLPAILLHASLTLSMDVSAIIHNPGMRFTFSILQK
jgi:membrane protease YdiL (CAAX protease family)